MRFEPPSASILPHSYSRLVRLVVIHVNLSRTFFHIRGEVSSVPNHDEYDYITVPYHDECDNSKVCSYN
jgi:hypothetical protein